MAPPQSVAKFGFVWPFWALGLEGLFPTLGVGLLDLYIKLFSSPGLLLAQAQSAQPGAQAQSVLECSSSVSSAQSPREPTKPEFPWSAQAYSVNF